MGKTKSEPWYFWERAESLLLVHFTRRDDLEITREPRETSGVLDFLVEIKVGGLRTGRLFGIELKAARNLNAKKIDEAKAFSHLIEIDLSNDPNEIPFPICLVVFDIVNDRGFYRWFNEPVIDPDGRPTLVDREENQFAPFDRPALDHIVNQVNQWYDQRTFRN